MLYVCLEQSVSMHQVPQTIDFIRLWSHYGRNDGNVNGMVTFHQSHFFKDEEWDYQMS